MTGALYPAARGRLWGGIALGSWAAAIALAPTFPYKLMLVAPAIVLPLAWWVLLGPARWIGCFLAAALLLPPLPFELGNTGPHACLLFAGLGLLAGLLSLPDWRMRWSEIDCALLTLFVILLGSVAPAAIHSGAAVAAESLARVALFGISIYVLSYAAHGPGAASRFGGAIGRLYG